jgi:hypothetical protein
MNDIQTFDPSVVQHLDTSEQACNYIMDRIEKARQAIKRYPSPESLIINSREHERWRMRTATLYGQAVGSLTALQAFGIISIEQFKALKKELLSTWSVRLSDEMAGNRIP